MTKTVIVHIGVHKTGSTAIQSFFWAQRHSLLSRGVLYPSSGRPINPTIQFGHHEIPWFLNKRINVTDPFPALVNEIQSENVSTILISSEEFDRLTDEEVARFVKAVPFNVKVIFYYRLQSEVLQGAYGTDVLHSGVLERITEYANTSDIELDFYKLAKRWANQIGKDNLVVQVYDRRNFRNTNIVADFIGKVDFLADKFDKIPDILDVNISVPWYPVQCIQHLWRLGIKKQIIYGMINRLKQVYSGRQTPYEFFSPSQAMAFDVSFAESNRHFHDEFAPKDKILIPRLRDDDDTAWTQARAGHYAAVEHLLKDILQSSTFLDKDNK